MNCPGHIQIFKHGLRSYRELPLRLAEFGVVHRYEPSGALHGLLRVRGFTQDDAHVFCTEEQMAEECLKINDLILSTYDDFGFQGDITVKLSTRPEKRVGTDEAWDHAEGIMQDVLKRIEAQGQGRIKTAINPGEGAFYGPKFEYVLARRHRPRLAVRHHAGRLQPAAALRRLLYRRRRLEEDAGDDPPRHLRLDGALPRHRARALCRPSAAVARAGAGDGRHHHAGRRRLRARSHGGGARRPACAPKSICATRRSTTRCASTRSPRCRRCWWSARRKPRRGRCRSAASAPTSQQVMSLDEALEDARRRSDAA